jgi:lipoprotein-anchoring transpeptidase ErfK/SrfK
MVPARQYFSEALQLGPDDPERTLLRAELTRLGNETIFSARIYEDDPFIERYIIQPGDTMGKIAKANHVTPELLAEINGIRNVNLIRAGQTIKVIKGPFRAVVDSRTYTLGVYLQNTFVKQFKVGLGADQSTPTGEWRVGTKLVNPTYYPPRSGQVIAADDPANPLGERWIALHGVSGEAAGQLRYGIHGTVEPDSIGKSVSLGCIRLYNEDVEALYNYLVEKESTVIVR